MELNDYQDKAIQTAKYLDPILYPTLGLTGEAGEVADKVKKVLRDKGGDFEDEAIRKSIMLELGDVLWYIATLSRDLGYTLDEVAQSNVDKLLDRKARNAISGSGDNR